MSQVSEFVTTVLLCIAALVHLIKIPLLFFSNPPKFFKTLAEPPKKYMLGLYYLVIVLVTVNLLSQRLGIC